MEHASLLGHSSSLLGIAGGVKAEKMIFSSILGKWTQSYKTSENGTFDNMFLACC